MRAQYGALVGVTEQWLMNPCYSDEKPPACDYMLTCVWTECVNVGTYMLLHMKGWVGLMESYYTPTANFPQFLFFPYSTHQCCTVLSLLQSTYRLLTHLSISLTISPDTWLNLTISLSTTTTSHLDHSKYLLASYLFWFSLPTIHFPHQARVSF